MKIDIPHFEQAQKSEKYLDTFFASKEFLEILHDCPDEARDALLGLGVEYCILDKHTERVSNYLRDVITRVREGLAAGRGTFGVSQNRIPMLLNHLFPEISFGSEREGDKEHVFKILNEYTKHGYMYHGFNGSFHRAILEHGLRPDIRDWDWQDLKSIQAITSRVGYSRALGWADLNSENKISLGDEPANIYRYSVASPEWFGQFIAEGFHIPLTPPYDKRAFYRRDYAAARKNIELFCARTMSQSTPEQIEARTGYPNMTAAERDEILAFFEKYWKRFAGEASKPMLALIRNEALGLGRAMFATYREWEAWAGEHHIRDTSLESYARLVLSSRQHDMQIDHPILPKDIVFIQLPEYQRVHADSPALIPNAAY